MKTFRNLFICLLTIGLMFCVSACAQNNEGNDGKTAGTSVAEGSQTKQEETTMSSPSENENKEADEIDGATTEESKKAENSEITDYVTREDLDEFVLVLLPGEDDPERVATRDVLREGLSEVLGMPVREFRGTDYAAVIEAMRGGQAQLANFGPFSYVHAKQRANAVPFCVSGNRETGEQGYYSYIVTRADSGIKSIQDLQGRTFAFVDPESTSGNVVPSDQILLAMDDPELSFDSLHLNGPFFSEVMFSGGHANSMRAVVNGSIDAAAVSSGTYNKEISTGNVKEEDIVIIHKSPLLPSNPWCFREDLDPELQKIVIDYFLSYDNADYWQGDESKGFLPIDDSAYDYVASLAEKYNLHD